MLYKHTLQTHNYFNLNNKHIQKETPYPFSFFRLTFEKNNTQTLIVEQDLPCNGRMGNHIKNKLM